MLSQVELVCEACLAGKHRHTLFPHQAQRWSTEVLQLLHGGIRGPITPLTPSGNRYFLLLVDDYSRYMCVNLCLYTHCRIWLESDHLLEVFAYIQACT
jgi:hypothetical protein